MKKAVILLAGLLTVLSMSFASAQFSDVPAGHWAKEAVEALASEGIILGFPDGTFRGNENLTRYQAAMIIYRLLQKLEPGQMASMDEETITALRNAVQELAAELASLGVRVSALEDNAATKDDVARLEKMIADLKGAAPAANTGDAAAIKDLADRVEAAAIAADTALAQVQDLSAKVDAIGAKADANADSIKALNELSVMLNQDVLSLQDRVAALEKASGMTDLSGIATKDDV
ncbi:S-layer homology domain-containing protein, partial [Oceanithermus sp.]